VQMIRMLLSTVAAAALLGMPHVFAPGVVSGPADDGTPTFTPDGATLYFTRSGPSGSGTILVSHRTASGWSEPKTASFSGTWNDQHPAISPDGNQMVFVSTRPAPSQSVRAARIWSMTRTPWGWSAPVPLPETVNIGRAIFAPSVAADGTIYFLSITKQGSGRRFQLYRSRVAHGRYERAQRLSFSSPATADVDPEIAPDQSYLVFASSGRRAGDDHEHLYVVRRAGEGWGRVEPLRYVGDNAKGPSNDNEPRIARGGNALYFSSDRLGAGDSNVWVAPFSAKRAARASSY
ncbi:MAG TPA: hypothetical protein VFN49_07525, partial [Candidatus Aquilonibacter sp.]|nr:hypothetical protein [Candidatus Aquilonibacter sp.]